MRGMAIIAVVMIHVTVAYDWLTGNSPLVIVNILLNRLSGYAVPLFVLISGIVLANGYWDRYDLKQFYIKRIKSIIPQYIFFTVFYIVWRVLFLAIPLTLLLVVYDFGTASGYYQMWFFALIIQLYIMYPLLEKIYQWFENRQIVVYLVIGSLLLQIVYNLLGSIFINMISSWHYSTVLSLMLFRLFPPYLFYFFLGIFVIRNIDAVKSWASNLNVSLIVALALALGGIATVQVVLNRMQMLSAPINYLWDIMSLNVILFILSFVLAYRLSVWLINRSSILLSVFKSIGRYSFGIFLVHSFFLTSITIGLNQIGITDTAWIFYPIAFVLTMGLSYLGVMLASYLPYSQYIVGTHNIIKTTGEPLSGAQRQ